MNSYLVQAKRHITINYSSNTRLDTLSIKLISEINDVFVPLYFYEKK